MLSSIFTTALLATTALAAPQLVLPGSQEVFSASALEKHLSEVPAGYYVDLDEKRLVQFSEDEDPVWITEKEKFMAKAKGLNFMDVTDIPWFAGAFVAPKDEQSYGAFSVSKKIKAVIETLSVEGPIENLQKFTSFRTRYYKSQTGRESQLWLMSKIGQITASTASPKLQNQISISEFTHPWGQNSIIAKIKGSEDSNGTVIISAHQDSTNLFPFLPAPGADDDGSGTVTILEAYRALLAAEFTPVHDVEFHWYSAEEGGLLGSQAVATEYASREAKILAQVQFDMTAWVKRGTKEVVGVVTDFVDPTLTGFIKTLIDQYLSIPWVETKCGYACSDHASWNKYGYPSAFGIESAFEAIDNHVHSTNDRIDVSDEFSFTHALEFSKLAVAYLVETAGWA
ncbi:peptidase [Clavulina sp. PMI_390]|nr:peptidase [Clavulina sp. PMI_390]